MWVAAGAVFPHQCILSVGTNLGLEELAPILLPLPRLSPPMIVLLMMVVTVSSNDRFRRQNLVQVNM